MFYVFSCKTSATLFGILKKKKKNFFQKNAVFNIDQSFSLKWVSNGNFKVTYGEWKHMICLIWWIGDPEGEIMLVDFTFPSLCC